MRDLRWLQSVNQHRIHALQTLRAIATVRDWLKRLDCTFDKMNMLSTFDKMNMLEHLQ